MPDDLAKTVSQNLFKIRKLKNLTQQEVAKKAGISQQVYAYYETGERSVPLKRLPSVAKALGTTPKELMGFK